MTLQLLSKAELAKEKPVKRLAPGTVLSEHMREAGAWKGKTMWEFIGTDDFGTQWNTRQQYEVDAGRDEEPILYTPLYQTTTDPALPKNVSINRIGPAGVFFSAMTEGGEVKFGSMGSSQQSIPMIDWTVGLEYSEQLVVYNEFWDVPAFERQAGIAHNALLNNIHLRPFIDYAYGANNQTAASALGTTLVEKYLRTIEDAVVNSSTDTANYRRGPYYILCSVANRFTIERALSVVPQFGVQYQSSVIGQIQGVIAYDGWVGAMGKESVTYPGITANKCYLIDVAPFLKMAYARSYVKFLLNKKIGNPDVSRLIAAQTVWWSSVGTFVNVPALAEEITLPTS